MTDTDTGHTRKRKRDAKGATRATTTTTTTMGQQNTKSYMGYMCGTGGKDI